MRDSWKLAACVAGCGALAVACDRASAQEFLLMNDGFPAAGVCNPACTGNLQMGFEEREIGAAAFILDERWFPLQILNVQILWFNNQAGGCGAPTNNIQEGIFVYSDLPQGGVADPHLVYGSPPIQLTAGFLNNFDLESENVIVENGGVNDSILIGMQFADGAAPASGGVVTDPCAATLVTDLNGAPNPVLSWVKATGGPLGPGWWPMSAFGVSGDIVIRAVVAPVCYADFDKSAGAISLDIFDFLAFQTAFVSNDRLACDCDTGTGRGLCDIFDFLCFQNAFVAGCP
ncbi:MAG: hypothetical protein IID31_09220 [Planctomycetes bacterium]|nr:hypothetical protein [Planctomycetota bacterium]